MNLTGSDIEPHTSVLAVGIVAWVIQENILPTSEASPPKLPRKSIEFFLCAYKQNDVNSLHLISTFSKGLSDIKS